MRRRLTVKILYRLNAKEISTGFEITHGFERRSRGLSALPVRYADRLAL